MRSGGVIPPRNERNKETVIKEDIKGDVLFDYKLTYTLRLKRKGETMEFTAITTQEEFDQRIGERLKRERESIENKYKDYDDLKTKNSEKDAKIGELEKQLRDAKAEHEQAIAEKDARIKGYESDSVKTRIAREMGLSFEAIDFISGDDEEAIRKSATTFKAYVDKAKGPAPSFTPEGEGASKNKDAGYKNMLAGMKGEE